MQKICRNILVLLLLNVICYLAKGQGCSDAGFCTLNSLKPNHQSDSTSLAKNQLKRGVSYGNADHAISVVGNYLEYNRQLSKKLGLDVKIASLAQNGNGISTFGLSDIYLNANYKLKQLTLTAGTKIPLTNGNKTKNNLSLPMDYQSSLGTLDLILGIGYTIKKIQLVAALQQPLTQNKNGHLSENYSSDSKLRSFQSTNNFKRSGDVLLRISYPVSLGEKLSITPGLLSIYHLTNDRYSDSSGVEKEIKGSEGLTLNGTIYADYALNDRNTIQLSMGRPFIFRESRPDGLTRSFVVTLEYQIKF